MAGVTHNLGPNPTDAGRVRWQMRKPTAGFYPADATIATDHDTIPNFAVDATIKSVQDGNWSSSSTWDLGRVPQAGDVVGVQRFHTVTYDADATTAFEAVGVAGTLAFRADADTTLYTQHLLVYGEEVLGEGNQGYLQIGTAASPIQAGFTAEVVFADVSIDKGTSASPGADPAQYGNGLLCWGKVRARGQAKANTFRRLSAEALATDTAFTFPSSVATDGWAAGDRLVIPDTRQLDASSRFSSYTAQWEERTITSLTSGNTVANFTGGLSYDHKGARLEDTTLDRYPHVANISRNVIFRSEDGTGVRGHCFFTHRANVDIRYAQFSQLGRTSNATLSSDFSLSGSQIGSISNASPIVVALASGLSVNLVTGDQVRIDGALGNTAANGTWTATVGDVNPNNIQEVWSFSLNTSTGNGTYTGGATVRHVGSQQIGRYAVHCHHLYGPVGGLGYDAAVDPLEFKPGDAANTTGADGASWRFVGCSIEDPLPASPSSSMPASKWGLAVHDSHWGLFKGNVIHHYAGSGLVTEDGSESYNVFEGNMVASIFGDVDQRKTDMRSGSGLTFQGYNNYVRGNVSAGNAGKASGIVEGSGYYYSTEPVGTDTVSVPDFQGADTHDAAESTDFARRDMPILQFADNEAYGAIATGLSIWWLGTGGGVGVMTADSTIDGLVVWHMYEEAYFGYPTDRLIIDGLVVRGDGGELSSDGPNGVQWGDYLASDSTIRNSDIRGVWVGVGPFNVTTHGTFTIQDTFLSAAKYGVRIAPQNDGGQNGTPRQDHTFHLDNVTYAQWGAEAGYFNILLDYDLSFGKTDLRVKSTILVTDHDGTPGDDLQLYYAEQTAATVMPQSTGGGGSPPNLVASPESGLTNAQNYVKYHQDGTLKVPEGALSDAEGCCIAGIIAPAGTTTRGDIDALVEEL